MSLSKVYVSSEVFEPASLVKTRLEQIPEKKPVRPQEPPPSADTQPPAVEVKGQHPPQPAPAAAEPPPDPGVPAEEVERLLEEARQQGIAEGRHQAEYEYGSAAAAMQLICGQLDELREVILKNSIGELRELVIAIAERIIRHSVTEQDQTIVSTVNEAIGKAVKSDEFLVFVHPDDYETIENRSGEMLSGINSLSNLSIKTDPSVERGGCRIESDKCTVDATIASQIDVVREELSRYEEPQQP